MGSKILVSFAFAVSTALAQGSAPTTNRTVVIAGGGTIGLSTAYWLSKDPERYTSIKILDPYPAPSFASAGWDHGHIVNTEHDDPMYSYIAEEAIELWNSDPVFSPEFQRTGYLIGTYDQRNTSDFDLAVSNTQQYGKANGLQVLTGDPRVAFGQWPWFRGVPPVGFRGAFNTNGGWVNSTGALDRVAKHLSSLGPRVQFVSGQKGTVNQLVRDGDTAKVMGVLAADGTFHRADIVVVAMGAWTGQVVDLQGQAYPSASVATHISLSSAERSSLANMSVFDIWTPGAKAEQAAGHFIPPGKSNLLKIVAKARNVNQYSRVGPQGTLVPPTLPNAHFPQNQLPEADVAKSRSFLRAWFPQFAEKEFVRSQASWTLSTFDSTWLLGPHPSSPENLFLATGGNGYTFKNFVNVGKYVKESIEGVLHENMVSAFSWRPQKVAAYGPPPQLPNIDTVDLVADGEEERDDGGYIGLLGGLLGSGGRVRT